MPTENQMDGHPVTCPLDPTTLKRERTDHYGITWPGDRHQAKAPANLVNAREKAQTALNKTSEQIKATGCIQANLFIK